MMVVKIADEGSFDELVLRADKPVLVDFYADWCGPCRMMAPVFEKLSDEISSIDFVKVNADQAPALAATWGISAIPCLILFREGGEARRFEGLMSEDALRQELQGV